jgi:hypothetical protein
MPSRFCCIAARMVKLESGNVAAKKQKLPARVEYQRKNAFREE